jgi:hypothetical protein
LLNYIPSSTLLKGATFETHWIERYREGNRGTPKLKTDSVKGFGKKMINLATLGFYLGLTFNQTSQPVAQ